MDAHDPLPDPDRRRPARHHPLLRQLDLAATIDDLVPWEGDVPLGTLVEVLITNRLAPAQGPLPRRRVGPGRRPDRLLRPDRRAAQRRPPRPRPGAARRARRDIQAALVLKAIEHFELDVTQIHYDSDHRRVVRGLRGRDGRGPAAADPVADLRPDQERPQARQAGPARARRHRRRRRAGRPPAAGRQRRARSPPPGQPQAAGPHPAQGQAAVHQRHQARRARRTCWRSRPARGSSSAAAPCSPQLQERYLGLRGELKPVDYYPESQAKRPAEERDAYKAVEVTEHLEGTGRREGGPARLPADLRLERVEGPPGGDHPRAAHGQDRWPSSRRCSGTWAGTASRRPRRSSAGWRRPRGSTPRARCSTTSSCRSPSGRFRLTWQFDAGRWSGGSTWKGSTC